MANFEQYPDYAMMDDPDGERRKRPWVSGPSPLSMALMTGGLGILAAPDRIRWGESGGGGGFDPSYIAQGGLLGLQAFGQEHQNLRNQRQDFFTQRRAEENQAITNIKANQEFKDSIQKEKQFPILIEKLRALKHPTITAKLPALMVMAKGNINSAYNTAVNLLSTATKAKQGKIRITDDGLIISDKLAADGTIIGETFHGQKTTPTKTKLSSFERINLALKSDGVPLGPGEYERLWNNHFQKETKYQKRYTEENVEQILKLRPNYLPDVFEYIEDYRQDLMSKPDGSIMTRAELKEKYNLSEPPKTVEEITSGIKKPSSDSIRDLLKIAGIKFTDTFLKKQLAKGDYDPTAINFETWFAYVRESGIKMPGPAKTYEDTAQVGARLFGYLMSGATVKEEEMTAMRTAFYPMPGDSPVDVKRKRDYRKAMVNIFISQLSPQMQTVINNEIKKIEQVASNPVRIQKEIKKVEKATVTKPEIIELDSMQSKKTLNNLWVK